MYGSVVTYLGTPEPLFRLGRKSRKAQVTTAPIAIDDADRHCNHNNHTNQLKIHIVWVNRQ